MWLVATVIMALVANVASPGPGVQDSHRVWVEVPGIIGKVIESGVWLPGLKVTRYMPCPDP